MAELSFYEAAGVTEDDFQAEANEEALRRMLARDWAKRQIAEADPSEIDGEHGWVSVDLGPYVRKEVTEHAPTVLRRTDGQGLLYPGINWMHCESGSGKSLIATVAATQEIQAGRIVVWLDYEEAAPTTLVARMLALGADPDALEALLIFAHPRTKATRQRLDWLVEAAMTRANGDPDRVSLVVLDSCGEAFGVEGINEDRDAEVAPWVNKVLRHLAEKLPSAAVTVIDHAVKSTDKAARLYPSGSKRKRAALTGVSLLVETIEPFARGIAGSVALVCAKDRKGHFAKGANVAIVSISSPASGTPIEVRIQPPVDRPPLLASPVVWGPLVQVVQAAKKAATSLSRNQLESSVTGVSAATKRAAIDWAVDLGVLDRTQDGQARRHSFVRELTYADYVQLTGEIPDGVVKGLPDASGSGSVEHPLESLPDDLD